MCSINKWGRKGQCHAILWVCWRRVACRTQSPKKNKMSLNDKRKYFFFGNKQWSTFDIPWYWIEQFNCYSSNCMPTSDGQKIENEEHVRVRINKAECSGVGLKGGLFICTAFNTPKNWPSLTFEQVTYEYCVGRMTKDYYVAFRM